MIDFLAGLVTAVAEFVALVLLVVGIAVWLYHEIPRRTDPVEELKAKRVADEISQDEFERRLELLLDDETERIQACVEPVPGIGPERSRYIAERYSSVEELRGADVDELLAIPSIGEQRAAALKERLS